MNIKAPEKFVDKRFRARSKFLVNRWRADVWYWGRVYMVRNLVLALIAVISSTAVDQFIMMGVTMVIFLVLSSGFMPWKDVRLAQFDNAMSFVVVFASTCGLAFMHFTVQSEYYATDTSEIAIFAREDAQFRMEVFAYLLYAAIGVVLALFTALLAYCAWWMRHMDKLSKEDAKANDLLVERWQVTLNHEHFHLEFGRLIATGTYHDIRALNYFLDNLQARLGGHRMFAGPMSPELSSSLSNRKLSQRLRTDSSSEPESGKKLGEASARLSKSKAEAADTNV
jgi:signal transduction histidine kinase